MHVCAHFNGRENMCVGEKDRDDWQEHGFIAAIAQAILLKNGK